MRKLSVAMLVCVSLSGCGMRYAIPVTASTLIVANQYQDKDWSAPAKLGAGIYFLWNIFFPDGLDY